MRYIFFALILIFLFSCRNYHKNRLRIVDIESQTEGDKLKLFFSLKYVSDSTKYGTPSMEVGLDGPIDSIETIYLYKIDSLGEYKYIDSIYSKKVVFHKSHDTREFKPLNLIDFVEAYNGRYFSVSGHNLQLHPMVFSIENFSNADSNLILEFHFFDGRTLTTSIRKLNNVLPKIDSNFITRCK